MPPPTGVVGGPLMATRKSRIASTVSFGSHSLNALNAFSPAKTSNHATRRFPRYAHSTAASNTRRDAFQMSRPVPSPSMNGIIGASGTCSSPPLYPIGLPSEGTTFPLYELFMNTAPWNKFDCSTGARGKGCAYNHHTARQAPVNWRRYHNHAAEEYNHARW